MRHWFCSFLISAVTLGFVAPATSAPPAATAVSAVEARQVRSVIAAQLKALGADDAAAAFAFAAPKIREAFGSPERFLAMVRDGYPVVYRPASVAYLVPQRESDGGGVVQDVHLTDADGTLWLARYHLERQRDKSWRISGCEVVQAEGRVA